MDWLILAVAWVVAIALMALVGSPRMRMRRRDRKRDREARSLLDQFGDPSPTSWPVDRLHWRKSYRTAWERDQDERRMFVLGFQADAMETDGLTYWEVAWVHRTLERVVEQAGDFSALAR
jgi:hypothetical protein